MRSANVDRGRSLQYLIAAARSHEVGFAELGLHPR
jgi:hypothetical protein